MSRSANWWMPVVGLLVAIAPVSCTKKTEPTSSTSMPPASAPVAVVAVDLGRTIDADKQVAERVDVFRPNDTIYASIRTSGVSPSTRLGVKWTYQDGQVVDQSEQMIAPDGAATTEFHITKPDGFPAGDYKVEIFVDGSPVQSKDFKVSTS